MVYYLISCGKKTLIKIFIIFFVTVITGFRFNVRKRLVPGNNYPGTFLTAKTCSAFLDSIIPFIISWVLTANMTQLVFTEIYYYLAQIFFIQLPNKDTFNGEYKRQLVKDFSNLKKTYKDLEVGMSIQSDTNQFSPEMTRINDYIVIDLIGVLSIESFESVITNPDRLRMLLRICREHDVEILAHKGKPIRADKETELAMQEILELSL